MRSENTSRDGIDIYYSETPDFHVVNTHFHNVYQMIYVCEGNASIKIDNKNYNVTKSCIIFISNLEKHSVSIQKSPYKRYVISLAPNFCHMMLKDSLLLSVLVQRPAEFSHVIALSDDLAESVEKILGAMMKEKNQQQAFYTIRLASLVTELLIRLYRCFGSYFPLNNKSRAANIVTDIQRYIADNAQNDLTLEQMAAMHYVSKYYLTRIFKDITGYTFKDYLILHRLSIAKDLLIHTDLSVTDVCFQSGYNNINHFIRIFKNYEGVTPYQYKKSYKPL